MKYKLLYIGTFGEFWVSDQYRQKGFEKVFDTKIFNYRHDGRADPYGMSNKLQKLVFDYKPNLIFINKGELIPSIVVERIKKLMPHIFIVNFNGDQRGDVQSSVILLGRVCDAILLNNHHQVQWDDYKKHGVKKIYEYHTATDPQVYLPMNLKKEYDVIFVGGHYGCKFPLSGFRSYCIRGLAEKYKVAVAGGKQWRNYNNILFLGHKYNEQTVEVVARAKMILGISAYNDICNYTSNRTWNSLACAKPYLCHTYKGINNYFQHNENILIFKDYPELVKQVEWVLDNPEKAEIIGRRGRGLVKKYHTYIHRAKQLKKIYEDWKHNYDK